MSVIIKYVIDFTRARFAVSNDLFKGDFILDASVRVVMSRGAAGGTFEIKLYDLPESKAEQLNETVKKPNDARVTIKLGYMDGDFDTVMEGIYSDVSATVEGDNLVTTVKGEESGTSALKRKQFQKGFDGKIDLSDAVTKLLQEAFPEARDAEEINQVPKVEKNVKVEVEDILLQGDTMMDVLDTLSHKVGAEFLVCDRTVQIGKPIMNDSYKPDEFDPDRNLAEFRPIAKNFAGEEGDNRLIKTPAADALGFRFIIAGDPRLRPAQSVFAKVETKNNGKVSGYRKKPGADFRIHSLVHSLNMTGGYTCEGTAVKPCQGDDDNCRRQQDALGLDNPDAIARKLAQKTKDELTRRAAIEVGAVKQYNAGDAGAAPHRSTLFSGQPFARGETQPSIRAEVEEKEKQLLRNKPIVSPFAWHKCGLVVPVYPGMKAVLGHNRNLPDDALVTGFLWSEKPTIEPPKSKAGDWWLCLPIDFGGSNPPPDSTKAANDLIANNGKRVIEVKGLKITIGNDKLANIGLRPAEGEDDEFLIEHKSGTKLKIAADGSLSIEAKTISFKGDVTFEGNVEIK